MAELVYRPVIGLALSLFKAWDLKIDMRGAENIPRAGGAVLASNHISYLDFIFDGYAALPSKRLVRFMAKDSVFRHKVSGPLMRGMRHIPVDRRKGEAAYAHALDSLRSGEVVGIFPEATISQSFCLKDFKKGAARLAQESGVPLIPMALWGTQRLWTKGRKRDFSRSHTPVTLRVGKPIDTSEGTPEELTTRLRERVQGLLDDARRDYPDQPSGPEDSWWLPAHLGGTAPTPEEVAGREKH